MENLNVNMPPVEGLEHFNIKLPEKNRFHLPVGNNDIYENPILRTAFEAFLNLEHCKENLDFIDDLRKVRYINVTIQNHEEMDAVLEKINHAINEVVNVSIDSKRRFMTSFNEYKQANTPETITKALSSIYKSFVGLFDDAFINLNDDAIPKFIKEEVPAESAPANIDQSASPKVGGLRRIASKLKLVKDIPSEQISSSSTSPKSGSESPPKLTTTEQASEQPSVVSSSPKVGTLRRIASALKLGKEIEESTYEAPPKHEAPPKPARPSGGWGSVKLRKQPSKESLDIVDSTSKTSSPDKPEKSIEDSSSASTVMNLGGRKRATTFKEVTEEDMRRRSVGKYGTKATGEDKEVPAELEEFRLEEQDPDSPPSPEKSPTLSPPQNPSSSGE